MALPTLEKTWQHSVNNAVGGSGVDTDNKDLLWRFKNLLIGFASGQWSVTSSSNGVAAPLLTDSWAAYANVVFDAGDHSWIVLTNSATGSQLCIDCIAAAADSQDSDIYFSPGGGYATTGLVRTARPAAPADEIKIGDQFALGMRNAGYSGKLHAMMSTDGECTRAMLCINNYATSLFLLDAVKSPESGWTSAVVATCRGVNTDADSPTYAAYNDAASSVAGYVDGGAATFFLTSEGYGAAMLGQNAAGTVANSQTVGWPMCPMGLASETAAKVGRKGALYDIWWGSVTRATGDTYPSDGSYQFAQFGDMIFPWNGTLPEVS